MKNPHSMSTPSAEHSRKMVDPNSAILPSNLEKEVAAFAKLKAPWSIQQGCPCCGIKTHSHGESSLHGTACDNSRWNWNGEPPFCCLCANLKGIGRLSHFGCEMCKSRRSMLYKRTSWCCPRCKNCGMQKREHIAADQRNFPRCPKSVDHFESCEHENITIVMEIGSTSKLL
eukprot:750977-Hanusia_phi.AAC.2